MSSPESVDGDFREICYLMGLALVTWQGIEDAHFKIFLKMLKVPMDDVSSVPYFAIESFASRHAMLDKMAQYFLAPRCFKKQRKEWQDLYTAAKNANDNRNKFAHYALDYDFIRHYERPDGSVVVEFTPHRLRPARQNAVSRLLGRTPDKDDHNLGPDQIKQYIVEFRQLAGQLELFHVSLSKPSEVPLIAGAHSTDSKPQHPQSPETLPPEGDPPSES
jgi:hypothetical protein